MLSRRALVVLAIAASTVLGCRSPDKGTVEAELDVGGRTRTYLYHVPKAASTGPRPLVVVLHGRLGTGVNTEDETRFSDIAERENFVVAYPDGYSRSWHDRREEGPAAENNVDDVAFISALIDTMVKDRGVDPKRVYAAGISNGGMMSFRLACELNDKIAAIAPVIALMPEQQACTPARPIPIAIFAGSDDPLVPYNGGEVSENKGRVLSADATRTRFAEMNGCDPIDYDITKDAVGDDDTTLHEVAHTKCKEGAEVRLYTFLGAGHTYPSGSQYLPKAIIGKVSKELDASEEIWAFFKRH